MEFCGGLVLESGERMMLHPYEREIVAEHFDGARRVVVIIGKKNGKTSLMAALALFHLQTVVNPSIFIAAAARDQATIIFQQAAGFVERSNLDGVFKVQKGYRRVILHGKPGELKVLAGDYDTAEGQIPTLALIDELHVHRSMALTTSLYLGLVPRDGQMMIISTAGSRAVSPLGLLRNEHHELPSFKRDHERKKNYATSEDGTLVWHEWCLDPTEDIEDMAVVKKANPAPWHTEQGLREFRAGVTTGEWMRFACGIWTEGENPWIEPRMWDDMAVEGLQIPDDSAVVLGLYAGLREQDSSIVIVRPTEDGIDCIAKVWSPPMEVTALEREIEQLAERYKVGLVAYAPPLNFVRSAEVLEAKGFTMFDFPISQARMEEASAELLGLIEEKAIRHDGDGTFRAHVLAGVTKQTEHGWRLVKDPTRRSIAALMGLVLAAHFREEAASTEPMFAFG